MEKAVAEKEQWLSKKWNAQSKLADHQDPAVLTSFINSEKKVICYRLFTLPWVINADNFWCFWIRVFGGRKLCLVRITWKMTYFLIIQTLKHCFEQTWYCSSLARLTAALLTQFTDCRELAEATTTTKEVETSIRNWFSFLPSCQTLSRLDSISFNLPNEAYNVCTSGQLLFYS